MGRIGPFELVLILAVFLLLFGARRIPEIARSLGRAVSQFRRGMMDEIAPEEPEEKKKESGREGRDS